MMCVDLNERYELGFQDRLREGVGSAIYRGAINSEPSDQTDLKQRCRCTLKGSGKPTYEAEDDRWTP